MDPEETVQPFQKENEQNTAAKVDPEETVQPFQKENEQNTGTKVDPEKTELKEKPFQEEDEQNKLDAEKFRKMKAQKNKREKKDNEKTEGTERADQTALVGEGAARARTLNGAVCRKNITSTGCELKQFVWTLLCGILQKKTCTLSTYNETVLAFKKEISFLKHILR